MTLKPREAVAAHACESQSPAQVLVEAELTPLAGIEDTVDATPKETLLEGMELAELGGVPLAVGVKDAVGVGVKEAEVEAKVVEGATPAEVLAGTTLLVIVSIAAVVDASAKADERDAEASTDSALKAARQAGTVQMTGNGGETGPRDAAESKDCRSAVNHAWEYHSGSYDRVSWPQT